MTKSDLTTNLDIAEITQACLGSITPNFRRVSIERHTDRVTLRFWLARDDERDRELINDILAEYEALQPGWINLYWQILVGEEDHTSYAGRAVYHRWEE